MGWASGSSLAEETWDLIRNYIPADRLESIANKFIDAFEDMDCDTMEECEQLMIDANRPEYCWDCDEEFARGTLNEDGLCKPCNDKEEDE